MSLLSIITINLNNKAGLEKTISSVVGQNADREFIVVDGGSNDGSVDVIRQHEKEISWWVSEKDSGIYNAMNKGIAQATGDYLLFLNSGDRLATPDTLRSVLPFLKSDTDIVYGNLKIEENGQLSDGFMPDVIDLKQMMNDTLWHPVSFIKRSLFSDFGLYDESYRIAGDYEFFFRTVIAKKVSTRHIAQFISIFDLQGLSSSANNVELIKKERDRAQQTWLSTEEISAFKATQQPVKKTSFFRKWFRS